MVSSACVELPRGPFGLVFSLRNIKNITRQVGVSLILPRGCLLRLVTGVYIVLKAELSNVGGL